MARSARSNYESNSEEFDTKRIAVMVGGGLAVVLALVFLGFKIFGSKSEAPRPAPPVAHAPQYPQEVTDLVTQTEQAFKADDFKAARADVDKLREISPAHPRLAFFEGLLTARADGSKSGTSGASGARGASKKNGQPSRRNGSGIAPDDKTATVAGMVGPATTKHDAASAISTGATSSAGSLGDASSPGSPALAPETPVGFSRAPTVPDEPQHDTAASATASAAASTPAPAAAPVPAPAATMAAAPPPSSPTHRAAGEPPPVIQEARLIRRVTPDYPSAAKKEGIAGSVDLDVTVSAQGVVQDVSVVQASPPELFEKSALAAVRKWKYDPRFVDGLPSQAHLKVHLDFGPNK